jgi:hypothetical protein
MMWQKSTQLEEKSLLSKQKVAASDELNCAETDWKMESESIMKTDLKSNIGIADMSLDQVAKILDKQLANEYLLFKGPSLWAPQLFYFTPSFRMSLKQTKEDAKDSRIDTNDAKMFELAIAEYMKPSNRLIAERVLRMPNARTADIL